MLRSTDIVSDPASPDTALLTAWVDNGDEEAFAALVERHVNLVYGVALRRLRDENAARDVAQTVFAIMARKAADLKDVRVLGAWLHRVSAAQSARALRQLIRHRRVEESVMQQASLHSGGRDPLAAVLPFLDEALDTLPERDRDLLMLRYSEGLSFAEASARTGRSEAALRQQAGRAVERLASTLRRKGVPVPVAVLTGGLVGAFSGGGSVDAGEITRAALTSAPAVSGSTLILTSFLTMSALKLSLYGAAAALLLTGLPAFWQGAELQRLRVASSSSPAPADQKTKVLPDTSAAENSAGSNGPKRQNARVSRAAPAVLDMEAIGTAVQNSMQGLLQEATNRLATIEARRTALALGLSADAEASLRSRVIEIWEEEFGEDSGAPDTNTEAAGESEGENFQQRMRRLMEEYLSATATPEQMERWRTLRRQRDETEIEKVAADAFHATARLVDLTAEQKEALFKSCSEQARELYATNWKNSFNAGAAISPRPPEPLENDESLLREILTPQQLMDWQTQSEIQKDFYNNLPHRALSRVFSVVSGKQLADAIGQDFPGAAGGNPPEPTNSDPR